MASHAEFLRDHHDGPEAEVITVIRGLHAAGERAADKPLREGLDEVLAAVDDVLAEAPSLAEHEALPKLVARLPLAPRLMTAAHLQPLRDAGYDDGDIHDAVNVCCCFSYMNRLADGLGVTAHPEDGSWAEKLLGPERLAAHRAWARSDPRRHDGGPPQ